MVGSYNLELRCYRSLATSTYWRLLSIWTVLYNGPKPRRLANILDSSESFVQWQIVSNWVLPAFLLRTTVELVVKLRDMSLHPLVDVAQHALFAWRVTDRWICKTCLLVLENFHQKAASRSYLIRKAQHRFVLPRCKILAMRCHLLELKTKNFTIILNLRRGRLRFWTWLIMTEVDGGLWLNQERSELSSGEVWKNHKLSIRDVKLWKPVFSPDRGFPVHFLFQIWHLQARW